MRSRKQRGTFQKRTIAALERAHFSAVQSELETEAIDYSPEDTECEALAVMESFEDRQSLGSGWVN